MMTEGGESKEKRIFDVVSVDRRCQLVDAKVQRLQLIAIVENLLVMMTGIYCDKAVHEARGEDNEEPKFQGDPNI